MGVSDEAKNVIPLKFLCKIKNKNVFPLVNSIRGHTVYDKKSGKWHYRVKSWVIFNKGQFTHIYQLNVSCGQDSMSGRVSCCKIFRNCLTKAHFTLILFTSNFASSNVRLASKKTGTIRKSSVRFY
jgi:hypothetical protein